VVTENGRSPCDGRVLARLFVMVQTWVAVLDAARARLFVYRRSADPDGIHEEFSEEADLVNLASRQRASELFSDTRPGLNRMGRARFGYDDHRNAHFDQLDLEFAREIAERVVALVRDHGAKRLVVCASPRMLGPVRARISGLQRDGVAVHDVAADIVKLSPSQLRDRLADYALLPARAPH
jgi:protein required for attachment to host cells